MYADGSYLEAHPTWHAEDSVWKAGHILRLLERSGLTPQTVAEIGCGAGGVLSAVAEGTGAKHAVGFDVSPQAIGLCRPLISDRVNFKLGDFFASEEHFDLLMAIDVFEHVEDYIGFIRAMKMRGGLAAFHIPLDVSVLTLLRSAHIRDARRISGHLHFYTKDMALATLEQAGYRVIDWQYTQRQDDFRRSMEARLLHWPRTILRKFSEDAAATIFGGCSLAVIAE